MGWRNWPSWLKGGVIGISLFLLYLLISIISSDLLQLGERAFVLALPLFLIAGEGIGTSDFLLGLIFTIIIYFILGAFIGWIVGKIRNR